MIHFLQIQDFYLVKFGKITKKPLMMAQNSKSIGSQCEVTGQDDQLSTNSCHYLRRMIFFVRLKMIEKYKFPAYINGDQKKANQNPTLFSFGLDKLKTGVRI